MTDIEVKIIKAELSQMAAKDKFSNICESALRLIDLYEAIILGNQMEIARLEKENEELKKQIETLKFILDMDNNELVKENAELKEKLNKKDCENCFFYSKGDKCDKGIYYASGTSVCNKFVGR